LVVNPAERLSAQTALNHPWIRTDDEILDKRDLTSTVEEMKKFNAKRKFRAGVEAVSSGGGSSCCSSRRRKS